MIFNCKIKDGKFEFKNESKFHKTIKRLKDGDYYFELNKIEKKLKDSKEFRGALHVFCEQLAEALNEAAIDMVSFYSQTRFDLRWTKYSVKDLIKMIGKQEFGKESTENYTANEVNLIKEILNYNIPRITGGEVTVPPFPSKKRKKDE
jgi:hypothetical protein